MEIRDKVVLITGASDGIGAACAAEFRARGARLALTGRNQAKLRNVAQADDLAVAGDITLADTRERLVNQTIERFGTIDILINNAGVGLYAPAWSVPLEQARRLFEVNFFGPLAMIQLVVPHMRERRRGMIVNVGSVAGKVTLPWFTLYSVSKYALGSLTDGLRMELKRDGIRAMMVCPGYVQTAFQRHVLGGMAPPGVRRRRNLTITAPKCARAIARGVERDARTVVTPRAGWLFVAAARLMPQLVDNQIERISRQTA